MKIVDLAKASKSLSAYAHDLGEEPVIVDRESLVLSTSPAFLRLMQAAREELARGDSVSLEEIKREPG
jgi:hypothetical protein